MRSASSPVRYAGRDRALTLPLLVAVVAVLPYLNSLGNELTFDDLFVVRDNPVVRDGSLAEILTWVYGPSGYRPLTMLTYAANARCGGGVAGFHLVNVGLHALASVAVFSLARLLLGSIAAATAAALVFAVHPIHTEAVTSIVGRAEVLACLLALLALLAAVRAEETRSRRRLWRAASLVFLMGGILAKESAFMAILLVGVVYLWTAPRPRIRRLVILLLPYAVVGVAYLALRLPLVGSLGLPTPPYFVDNPLAHATAGVRVRTAVVILWQYLSQLAVPWQLSADYSYDQITLATSPLDWRFLTAMALFMALGGSLLFAARRAPALLLAACFTAIPLGLTANILFPIGTIKAERLLYMPSVGWCLLWGWLGAQATRRYRLPGTILFCLLVAALGMRTWVRNADWRNSLTLFSATAATSPRSTKAHFNLAFALHEADRREEAMLHYRQSLAIYDSSIAAFGIARIYETRGARGAALTWYERAVRSDWRNPLPHLNAGLLHYLEGRLTSSEAALRAAVAEAPEDPRAKLNLAVALLADGRLPEAFFAFAELDPHGIEDPAFLDTWSDTRRALVEAEWR